ncbi:SDR family NAD(P)-dependent oxidoreductase [Chitinophaga nivalis]|uniref:SDR family NAD(P)-dependent oxidoreductase n=1 Tax=Chitinophaga nivalis TaxID=2991709 RepID=A0ABT3IMX9_9BACT|nr:SDR family NAD(P)-dependent oxidoreductase [Chitinophaga nivalis]MCW3464993.1 SDR family NAD(P)-dependent oxidoreductase [Chitinophaga nivalis]MCW3485315.1 SDR family NAD(P)-dependent oxidoreductase [Chitinophaga nivalis]
MAVTSTNNKEQAIAARSRDIAVIGMSCRFPGATDYRQYWENIVNGTCHTGEIPTDRWKGDEPVFQDMDERDSEACKWGGVITDVTAFDAAFFNISAEEAKRMDPQQRIMLELTWSCLEDAGIPPCDLSGSNTGVYLGVFNVDYKELLEGTMHTSIVAYHGTGAAATIIPNRISYYYNWNGPSVAIDTACSGSLQAIHLAIQALLLGECEMAFAGGVNLILTPAKHIAFAKAGMLSPSGTIRTFDEEADGYVRSEGAGLLLLKPLDKALADGNTIYGVIKGSAVNHGGKSFTITYPNKEAQATVIRTAMEHAGITPETISYVEAHGTGTPKGDPIEIAGLMAAFTTAGHKAPVASCGLGSVKANIGHAEAAAGVAGVIKVLLSMKEGLLPAQVNFSKQNPRIDIADSPFYIVTQSQKWPAASLHTTDYHPRRAGVSSFGFGGTNAHVIIEESPLVSPAEKRLCPVYLIGLSAKNKAALHRKAGDLLAWLDKEDTRICLHDMSVTCLLGREHFRVRHAFVVPDTATLKEELRQYLLSDINAANKIESEQAQAAWQDESGNMLLEALSGDVMINRDEYTRKLKLLAELYIAGTPVDWKRLFPGTEKIRIPLPTYPFAKEKYWIDAREVIPVKDNQPACLHPLLQVNISTLYQQRFRSIFSGEEFFFQDNVIDNHRILPGGAYLEMARAAMAIGMELPAGAAGMFELTQVVWPEPLIVTGKEQATYIALEDTGGHLRFSVYTLDDRAEKHLHGQGACRWQENEVLATWDIPQLQSRCTAGYYSGAACYDIFNRMGSHYGPAHRGIKACWRGEDEVLAALAVPVTADHADYILHPGLLDSAVQTCLLLLNDHTIADHLLIPFSLDKIKFYNTALTGPAYWSIVRFVADSSAVAAMPRLDIDICDEQGKVVVSLCGLGLRATTEGMAALPNQEKSNTLFPAEKSTKSLQQPIPEEDEDVLQLHIQQVLIAQVARQLELTPDQLDGNSQLSEYGFDSIQLTRFYNYLNSTYHLSLLPTLYFEYPTLAALAGYLQEHHGASFARQPVSGRREEKPAESVRPGLLPLPAAHAQVGIAVIGISGRFPQAEGIHAFWENLLAERDCISEVPADRWDWRAAGTLRWGGFMEDIGAFDPLFFNIAPHEATYMDPQQRLIMEYVWKVIEDGGYSARQVSGSSMGIFIGTSCTEYGELITLSNMPTEPFSATGRISSVGPNRMSYVLNLHGPSEPIETACSSSLVAIHRAVTYIREGGSEMAIAGGINTLMCPGSFVSFGKAGMLSESGRCKTFAATADGYVRGEGVGMLLLKRLDAAERDGDHIYGIIRGSGENHGGHASSFTAPNTKSQAALLQQVYENAGIAPWTVSYIEAHGTGTPLGDPVEVNALQAAFSALQAQHDYKEVPAGYCGLGSVKSNIGHLELAAGVVGVIKVLLQMQHQVLVKSLHSETLNPYLNLNGSPFYVVQETRHWSTLYDEEGNRLPRRAGVSSFGVGGVNAHVILEEYNAPFKAPADVPATPVLLVLSARNKERLTEMAAGLHKALAAGRYTNKDLPSIAYTLQTGREAMKERLACCVTDIPELLNSLETFIHKRPETTHTLYQGEVNIHKESATVWADEDGEQEGWSWIAKGAYDRLLLAWVAGYPINWQLLYHTGNPGRISLPTYPFAKENYWINVADEIGKKTVSHLHPLLQSNTSTLQQQRFSSTFNGTEFFLRDHVLNGKKVLPGMAYLEMARMAVVLAQEAPGEVIELKQEIWFQPLIVAEKPVEVHISLYEQQGDIQYDIYTRNETGEEQLHSQGAAHLHGLMALPVGDIAAMRSRCDKTYLSGEECYRMYDRLGLHYGTEHRCITGLWQGKGEALVQLTLSASADRTGYTLHPGLVDSAVQGVMALFINDSVEAVDRLLIPFSLDQALIAPAAITGNTYWGLIRFSAGSNRDAALPRLDIDVCDENGQMLVRLCGLGVRAAGGSPAPAVKPAATLPDTGVFLYIPVLAEEKGAPPQKPREERIVILCELPDALPEAIIKESGNIRHIVLQATGAVAERYYTYSQQLYSLLQELLRSLPPGGILLQLVTAGGAASEVFQGLNGLLHTACKECLQLRNQQCHIAGEVTATQLIAWLQADAATVDKEIRYQDGLRYTESWRLWKEDTTIPLPWKSSGVYVITGGNGGLGRLFGAEILQQAPGARVILIGRREQPDMETPGTIYKSCDITAAAAVDTLFDWIDQTYGQVDGIIHAAGVLNDCLIIRKDVAEINRVLAPKVNGLLHLDARSAVYNLDFFVCFSSIAGAVGNMGQGDYAVANSFMDHYAAYRNELVMAGVRSGHTLSVNWPLWADGGMQVDTVTERLMLQTMGLVPLLAADGIHCFYQALHTRCARVLVLCGIQTKMEQLVSTVMPDNTDVRQSLTGGTAEEHIRRLLLLRLSKQLGIPEGQLDEDSSLGEYGLDSIQLTHFFNELNSVYQLTLTPALFFEYHTIAALSAYLGDTYGHHFISQAAVGETPAIKDAFAVAPDISLSRRRRQPVQVVTALPDIAIIGMSGRFPQAADIAAFWENLVAERDCISEVPADRWNWRTAETMQWGGFIEDVYAFDPLFFNISPHEAQYMDPQQRLLMEYVWQVIEDGGYSAGQLSDSPTGLFVGTSSNEYMQLLLINSPTVDGIGITGLAPSLGPGRMSYFLNLHGPSEPVETACSSSLVAIHRAVEYIRQGHGEMAIAGGVNTLISPIASQVFASAGILCRDGHCKTFAAGADGYVRGEGVGMLLLKRLDAAERDRDHIYGVIRGTAENHGGAASSLTAPNGASQTALLQKVYAQAGVAPATIGYMEAHGTGTALGDPVEVNALKAVFGDNLSAGQAPVCGLGSVKSNIGHLELAAGVAGVIKVLLQLQHKTLVKSLHSEVLNPYLQLDNTPFYVLQKTRAWDTIRDEAGNALPRRAGVSSFGLGGVNAHVILEEYIPPADTVQEMFTGPVLIVLSARNRNRLEAIASRLYQLLETGRYSEKELVSIAYTLQVGREAMEERAAFIAGNIPEVISGLKALTHTAPDTPTMIYRGQIKANKDMLHLLAQDEDMRKAMQTWMEKRKYNKLLELWVKGYQVDWALLYGAGKPYRISLPVYPFVRDVYRTDMSVGGVLPTARALSRLHPLLHTNISSLYQQCFSSVFSGKEAVMHHYSINGQPLLPAMAYLEMVRAALLIATERSATQPVNLELTNIIWPELLTIQEKPVALQLSLQERGGSIQYEVHAAVATAVPVYCRGMGHMREQLAWPVHDMTAWQSEMTDDLSGDACYEWYRQAGLSVEAHRRCITGIWKGTAGVLVQLSVPASTGQDGYKWHPLLLESAWQGSMVLYRNTGTEQPARLLFPYSLDKVLLSGNTLTGDSCWSIIRFSAGSSADAAMPRLDIDLCDEQGNVLVGFYGLSLRAIEITQQTPERSSSAVMPLSNEAAADEELQEYIHRLLLAHISQQLDIPIDQLGDGNDLAEYGLDSVQLGLFFSGLNDTYGLTLTPALFFEYPTLPALAGYLSKKHRTLFSLPSPTVTPPSVRQEIPAAAIPVPIAAPVRTRRLSGADNAPIAVIGMSGRFPQAADITAFWENLMAERDCISEVPPDRWSWRAEGTLPWGGFMEDVAAFDPLFFNISPQEAYHMDPQQRLLMEYVWKVMEDAGYSPEQLSGSSTGLFIGISCGEYAQLLSRSNTQIEGFSAIGLVSSVGPNRMSYLLNLHGASEPVETACSSSLVAIHRAVEYIQQGHGEMAVAGGVNTLISHEICISLGKAGMLSQDGRCKTFSAEADGYVRGEGVGMLLLKRLDAAERDGDHIYGVIRGTAENHGGHASSLTAPSTNAQTALLQKAYEKAGIAPWTVGYIEAHGTGTRLGDPVEVNALKAAFREYRQNNAAPGVAYCGLGSVKSNIGHLEVAAGVVSMIKVLLQLQHRTLVKSLHTASLNPQLVLEDSPFYVVQQTRPWEPMYDQAGCVLPLRAGVSSFGFGGVNAHVVLEEYIAPEKPLLPVTPVMIVLSARNSVRLKELATRLHQVLATGTYENKDLAAIAFTLQVGREAMEERMAFIAGDIQELLKGLQYFMKPEKGAAVLLYQGQVKGNKEALHAFTRDEDMVQTMLAWIEKRKYNKLLDVWVKGYPVDWKLLYKEGNPGRISLPGYPFAKERYWVDNQIPAVTGTSLRKEGNAAPHKTFDDVFYDQLIDQVMNGTTSIDKAAFKVRNKN